ncbi:MAG: glycosyltransferase family 2 protein [Acidobacteriia bacterium]|nr:glycosyltransferase family 2 protein [Terriglobia bacterium]
MSTREPKVSIIILNWNSFEVTLDCLVSLRKMEYRNFEVVLVDNGSVDSSPDKLAESAPEARILRNPANLGFTGGNNVGIRDALERNPDYLLLLNNDTIVAPDFLSKMVEVAESDPRIGILNPKIYYFEPSNRLWHAGGVHKPWWSSAKSLGCKKIDNGDYDKVREVSFVTGCALLIKAGIVKQIGLLDEMYFLGWEDVDWTVRVMQAGYKAFYVPQSKIWHRESYDTKKNGGKKLRDYYGIRNSILFARKHMPAWWYWPGYFFSMARRMAYMTGGYLLMADPARIGAIYRGVWSGCSTRITAQSEGSASRDKPIVIRRLSS